MISSPCLAHYGTTLIEPPIDNAHIQDAPLVGQVLETARFLESLGFRPKITNIYPGLGRQWITCRGDEGAPDYLEKDSFSSFAASPLQAESDGRPRSGDVVFRLPEADPATTLDRLRADGYVRNYLDSDGQFFVGPDGATYELAPATDDPAENRTISIWTAAEDVERIAKDYETFFHLTTIARNVAVDGLACARAMVLRRTSPGPITIRLLTPGDGRDVAPQIVGANFATNPGEDIFTQGGYGHFRLGSPDRDAVRENSRKVFDDTGDVAYSLFHHAYLELVDLDPA